MVCRSKALAACGLFMALLCLEKGVAEEGNPARLHLLAEEQLARVGDRVITLDEFRAEMARRSERSGGQPASADVFLAVLEEMVQKQVLLTRAREAGYADDPELLAAFERLLIRAYLRDRLEAELDLLVVTDAEVEARYQEELAKAGPAREMPFLRLAPGIRHQLLREKRAAREAAFQKEIRSGLVIEIDETRLRELGIPTADQAPPAMPTTSLPTEAAPFVSSSGEKP